MRRAWRARWARRAELGHRAGREEVGLDSGREHDVFINSANFGYVGPRCRLFPKKRYAESQSQPTDRREEANERKERGWPVEGGKEV